MISNKKLIKYAKCCVNLYGVVSLDEIIQIVNHYDNEIVPFDLYAEILDNFITKRTIIQKEQGLYYKKTAITKDIVVSFYDRVKTLPLYTFKRKIDFFYYESATYSYGVYPSARNLHEFLSEIIPDTVEDAYLICEAIDEYIGLSLMASTSITEVLKDCSEFWMSDYLVTKEHVDSFLQILADVNNHSRMYLLRGHTPLEFKEL